MVMVMNLGEFHSLVSTTLNRGTTLDARIPRMVELAAGWFERNYTFKYMEHFSLLQIHKGDRTIDMPIKMLVKGFKFLRLLTKENKYDYLNKIEPEQSSGLDNKLSAYWLIGNSKLVFNSIPAEDLNGEAMWYIYTDWPVLLGAEHPLIDTAKDVLLAQTMLFIAAFVTRDERMASAYKALRDEGLNTMTRAEDEVKFAGEGLSMGYRPFGVAS